MPTLTPEQHAPARPQYPSGRNIAPETGLLALLCVVDMIVTVWLVATEQAVEANPLLRGCFNAGIPAFVAVKTLLTLVPVCGLELLRHQNPRFVGKMLRIAVTLYVTIYSASVLWANFDR
jgi:hypothetical protein